MAVSHCGREFGYSDDISAWYRILFWKKNIFDENEDDWDTAN